MLARLAPQRSLTFGLLGRFLRNVQFPARRKISRCRVFASGFKVNSAVWRARRSFRDQRHIAWQHITQEDTERMWRDLEGMGVSFVDGIMPPYGSKKKK